MRVSEQEKELLGFLELRGSDSLTDLHREFGVRNHTLRYRMKRLAEADVLGSKRPYIRSSTF